MAAGFPRGAQLGNLSMVKLTIPLHWVSATSQNCHVTLWSKHASGMKSATAELQQTNHFILSHREVGRPLQKVERISSYQLQILDEDA